jgi:lambda family phage portal protein
MKALRKQSVFRVGTAEGNSANREVQGGIVTLRNRARDLRRNNPYATKGIQVISSNVVGHGIATQFRATNAATLEKKWNTWAESTEIDFDGRNTIYGIQRLVMEAVAESGEVLVRKRFNSALAFPLQYQVLESDFLDVTRNETADNGNLIIQGIEFDKQGRRQAYYLFETHPGGLEGSLAGLSLKSNRIPADEVHHVYRMDRPGQVRGITWLAPCIVRLKDLDDYEDAQLTRQKIAACFTVFVRDISADYAEPLDDYEAPELGDRVEPGIIEHLPTGKEVQFANPPEVQNYDQFVKVVLRSVAAGLGITYETLTGDLSGVNFSSGRMGWIEMLRNIQTWRSDLMQTQFLDKVARDFLNIATIQGERTEGAEFVHAPPKREMIDPTKEIPATIEAIEAGLTTLSDELLAQGKDPKKHLEQYAADQKELDRLGLKLKGDLRVEIEADAAKRGKNETESKDSNQSDAA